MKIGVIGPNKIYSGDINERKILLDRVAQIISKSKNEIILTPDKDSLLEYFGKKYLELGGKSITLIIPTLEHNYDSYLNTSLGEVISCSNWDCQADEFNRQCDIFVCVGYAWGALKEIACAQYFNEKKIYILNEFISAKLPEELNFLLEYISVDDLKNKII
jgi:predicted Rossmann-fold nucleotide-binding protein